MVLALRNSAAATSRFVRPCATCKAIWSSGAVSSSVAIAGAAEPVGPPVARSSPRARSAHGSGPGRPDTARAGAQGAGGARPAVQAPGGRVPKGPGCARAALAPPQPLAMQELGAGGLERLARLLVELQG